MRSFASQQHLSSRLTVAVRPGASNKRAVHARGERDPREGNVDGQFFVDHTCINCDTCRWMAPDSFSQVGPKSAVTAQPETRDQRIKAIQATLSCPTFSIHMRHKDSEELREAQNGMPIPVEGCPGIYHCGYHSENSFGATSYLLVRGNGLGNIMMDCPRFNPKLAKNIEALGGVEHIVLSHIDDICDHAKWAKHFGAPRLIHAKELEPHGQDLFGNDASNMELHITGTGPWDLQGNMIGDDELDGGIQLVHTPGHTEGHICMWHPETKTIFTGDHLGYANSVQRPSIFPRYNKDSKAQQVESVKKLLKFDFEHVLPGHGRRFHVSGKQEREQMVAETAEVELQLAGAA